MALHPEDHERNTPEDLPIGWDLTRREPSLDTDWYRDLVEHSDDMLWVHDLQGRLLSTNPVPARLLGYNVSELLQIPMREFIDPQFRKQFDDYLREIERTGEAHGVLAVVTRTGERRFWEYSNALRTEGMDTPVVRGIAHDVTDRVRVERSLRETNEKLSQHASRLDTSVRELKLFRTLLDQSNDAIVVVDATTMGILDVNQKMCSELGYGREELLSMTIYAINPTITLGSASQRVKRLKESGFAAWETIHKRKDGTTLPVEVNAKYVHLDREYLVALSRDITERKRAAKLLEESEKRFRTVYEGCPVGICLIETSTGRFLQANPKYCEIVGRTEQDLLTGDFFSITHPDDVMENRTKAIALSTGEVPSYEIEKRYVRPDGSIRWVHVNAVNLPREGTNAPWSIGIVQDITERKQAEQALRESEARERARARELETVLDTLPVSVLIAHDPQCHRMTANRARLEALHLEPGANASASAPPGEQRPNLRFFRDGIEISSDELPMQRAAATGHPTRQMTLKLVFEDGSERYELGNAAPLLDEEGHVRGAVGASIDVTDRVRTEETLRESEERLRLALEVAHVGMFERDLVNGESRWTPQMEAIYGLGPGEYPRTLDKFLSLVHPEDRPEVSRLIRQSMDSGEAQGEWRVTWPDGTVHWIAGRWRTLKDASGNPVRAIGMDFDITERKQTEEALHLSEERFRVALKHSPIAVFNQDRDLRYTWIYNPQMPLPASEKIGKSLAELFGTDESGRVTEVRRRVLETGVGVRDEMQFIYGGKKHYFDTRIEPVMGPDGSVIGLTGASTEITELREATEALREAKQRLVEEKLYLEHEIDAEMGFGEIIGQSRSLQEVMRLASTVASSGATVLLLGETGTGKELVARAIHRMSRRAANSFIKLNCAATPYGLLESELFGSEKGPFTGSVSRRPGRLELSDNGTLFLDEIGEISLDLQPKLLRVLQDHEFERLGGTQTLKVNFRLIAATNRDLASCVRDGEFRSDLYYRLNVFPIRVPPLRERRDDIPILVEYFVQKCARRMNKTITSIPKKTVEALKEWEWPGNIRELENFIERSVILTLGSVLVAPLSELQTTSPGGPRTEEIRDETLEAAEREHILKVMQECHGQIGGSTGAAARLGMKRTTLQSKLKRLGINPTREPRKHQPSAHVPHTARHPAGIKTR